MDDRNAEIEDRSRLKTDSSFCLIERLKKLLASVSQPKQNSSRPEGDGPVLRGVHLRPGFLSEYRERVYGLTWDFLMPAPEPKCLLASRMVGPLRRSVLVPIIIK